MDPDFAKRLGICNWKNQVWALKIDKTRKSMIFKGIFSLADISISIAFEMPFLTFKINFINQKPNLGLFTTVKALPITKQIELVEKIECVVAALNLKDEIFVIHIICLTSSDPDIYSSYKT